jgi:aminoglycoside phosphotransferase (APT) family kinase protein
MHTFSFVVPDATSSVLLIEDGAGWSLPTMTSDEPEIVIGVAPALREIVGQDVVILRDVRFGPMPPPDDKLVYLTETVAQPDAVQGRWCSRADLDDVDLSDPRDREALEAWSSEDVPPTLQPWQQDGWHAQAVAWIRESLPGPLEVGQFATWCNSSVLRVVTPRGRFWFKAVAKHWRQEPAVTRMLGDLFSGRTPRVIECDTERGWMLLDDLNGSPADVLPLERRLEALTAMADLHRAGVPLLEELMTGGCVDRRPAVLADQIEALAADGTVALPDDLQRRFRTAVPRLQELCVELSAAPIPATLVHGDLHAGNVMRLDDRYVVFDWSDACVADPFVDVLMFTSRMPDGPEVRAAARRRYFSTTWPDVTGSDAASYAELAEPLAAMHHAVTYRGIYDAFGPYEWWYFEDVLPRWIEHALTCPSVDA